MSKNTVLILDNDKDFLELYSKLLQSKGVQVFATDNLFLLLKYAKNTSPDWIFIDEHFTFNHEAELIKILNRNITYNMANFAILGATKRNKALPLKSDIEFIYKPHMLEKVIKITENCCNTH